MSTSKLDPAVNDDNNDDDNDYCIVRMCLTDWAIEYRD